MTLIPAAWDENVRVHMAILDFPKAFDMVPHKRLMHKLQHYGISGNTHSWITSFLTNRNQQVVIDGDASKFQNLFPEHYIIAMQS